MNPKHFDLNDIDHEPSDAQLAGLMEAVAAEARRRGKNAREAFLAELRAGLKEAGLRSQENHAG